MQVGFRLPQNRFACFGNGLGNGNIPRQKYTKIRRAARIRRKPQARPPGRPKTGESAQCTNVRTFLFPRGPPSAPPKRLSQEKEFLGPRRPRIKIKCTKCTNFYYWLRHTRRVPRKHSGGWPERDRKYTKQTISRHGTQMYECANFILLLEGRCLSSQWGR